MTGIPALKVAAFPITGLVLAAFIYVIILALVQGESIGDSAMVGLYAAFFALLAGLFILVPNFIAVKGASLTGAADPVRYFLTVAVIFIPAYLLWVKFLRSFFSVMNFKFTFGDWRDIALVAINLALLGYAIVRYGSFDA